MITLLQPIKWSIYYSQSNDQSAVANQIINLLQPIQSSPLSAHHVALTTLLSLQPITATVVIITEVQDGEFVQIVYKEVNTVICHLYDFPKILH